MTPNDTIAMYAVRIAGHLDPRWLRWLEGQVTVQYTESATIIAGPLDQAALHGILSRIGDLGIELLSVEQIAPDAGLPDSPDV